MHYKISDPARTSHRHPFYGYGADDPNAVPPTGTPTGVPTTLETTPPAVDTRPIVLAPQTQAKQSFSLLGPVVAFGTSFLASYVVAKHVGVDKPKAMNLAITMGILSGIGQAAAQVLQGWIEKAQKQIDSGAVSTTGSLTSGSSALATLTDQSKSI